MRQSSSQTRNCLVVVCMAVSLVAGVLFFTSRALMQGGTTLADDFNDNSLNTTKWDPNNLFSGFTDTSLPLAEVNQRLEIGPLLTNTGSSHYRGIRSVNTYNFSNSYSYVELVQAPSSSTVADAMFTIGNDVNNFYRLYVSGGVLYGQRKIAGTKTTLFTLSYDSTNHRFLRIRHDSNTGNLTLDTAPGSGGVPGTWVQRYSETWNSAITLSGMIFEIKGGTSVAETNAPGTVIFDNFQFAGNGTPANPPTVTAISPTSGSTSGGTSVTITGTNFVSGATVSLGGSAATGVSVVSSTSITATTPAHAAGAVNVVVTNPDTQSGTLNSGFTYSSGGGGSETVLLADDFNDNSLDTSKWDANNLFSGFTDTGLPVAETNQQFQVGPLLQNTSGSHYRGIRSVNTYGFSGAYSYVELVQAPPSSTTADAMFTVGVNVDNYYRLYVSGGTLYGLRKVGGTKTTLFTLTYNPTNHRFLRIRHDASTGNVTLDTATGSAGVPGTWVQQYSETWNPSISLTGIIFEIKGGTSVAETNAPGTVIFDNFKAAIPGSGGGSGSPPSTGTERLDPNNRTGGGGENPLSRNFNWSIPLVQLPGRAGLDLGISLAYNSLVWTRSGSSISFDDDHGFPSPGFHLGFPVIQSFFNTALNQNGYLLLASDGRRIELRQVGATTLYQAVDSSYLLFNSSTMKLQTGDGMQLSYVAQGTDLQCTEIKDRNGNFVTINYTGFGRVDTVIDTLNRTIKFNYDANNFLTSITQTWTVNGSAVTHTWAAFEYRNPNLTISTNFTGLTVFGAQNGATLKVLSRVILADNSRFEFDYTSWGQVSKISGIANDGVTLLNYRSYNLPLDNSSAQTDCPRFTQRRDWAKYWNRDAGGNEQEAITSFIVPTSTSWTMPAPDGSSQSGMMCQVSLPDGTSQKMYSHASGWDKGLPLLTETYDSAPALQRQVMTAWTQDNTGLTVPLNPRITETNTYDTAANRKRTRISYQQISLPDGTACSLPQDIFEYQANATTVLRSTRTTYNTNSAYTSRRIIGLVSDQSVYEGDVTAGAPLTSKLSYQYDETGSIQGSDAPVQHDNTNYSSAFVVGRANLSSVKRYDVNNTSQFTTSTNKYNTAGAIVSTTDASAHTAQISYTDAFSDNVSRNTLAYATTFSDPDNYTATAKYNFDSGAVTYKRTPQTGTTSNLPGPEQSFTYDSIGRLDRSTSLVNNSYIRYIYGPNYVRSLSTVNTVADEAQAIQISDGAGRVIATARNHPGSAGGFGGQLTIYDAMGRPIKESNPTETSVTIPQPAAPINPYGWSATGDDAGAGWVYTQQTYDWKGRPLVTINQDGTTTSASYTGCGCAGGEVVTLTDEGTIDPADDVTPRKRQTKIYSDILGRKVKTEVLQWENGAVNSATANTYNARDQVTLLREFSGAAPSDLSDLSCPTGTCQKTESTYDGFGRLKTKHTPSQQVDTNNPASTDHITWDYNPDDTIQKITDARGTVSNFSYNARRLVTGVTYNLLPGVPTTGPSGVAPTASVSYGYDAAGNRMSMTDGMGSVSYGYDQLSRLTSETRFFSSLTSSSTGGNYTIGYGYNLANALTSITDPFGIQINYSFDNVGRLSGVTSPNLAVSNLVSNIQYRAWGAPRSVTHGDNRTATTTYDSRLRIASYELAIVPQDSLRLREQYQYYADGRLRKMTDLDDHEPSIIGAPDTARHFSRMYHFDYDGRLVRARGFSIFLNAEIDQPFKQFYGYDAFDNMTSRSGGYYYQTSTSDNASFDNNRRVGSVYAADGQETHSTGPGMFRDWVYDTAGKMIQVKETVTATNQFSTYVASYDGDGRKVREFLQEDPVNTNAYILYSTVLGGKTLTRLNNSGSKVNTIVPIDDQVTPLIIGTGDTGSVGWVHKDPLNLSYGGDTKTVIDPLGNDIRWQPVPTGPSPLTYPRSSASMGGLGSSFGSAQDRGCVFNDLPISCQKLAHLIDIGNVSAIVGSGVDAFEAPVVSFGLGMWQVWIPDRDGQKLGQSNGKDDGDTIVINHDEDDKKGHYEYFFFPYPLSPLNPPPDPTGPTKEDDPTEIQGEQNGDKCGIVVTLKPGTKDPVSGLPNGPSTVYYGGASFGLGFTVTGWVSGNGIGTIGVNSDTGKKVPNPANPKGSWSLEQWTTSWMGQDGKTTLDKKTFADLPLNEAGLKIDGNKFSFYDHPGGTSNPSGFSRFENHLIKVYSGKTYCEVKLHFIQIGNTIHWGAGLL